MEETDGCAKQYRRASAINVLRMLSMKYNIFIDRAVGAQGHGKDIVDGLNAVDKSFAAECRRLLQNQADNIASMITSKRKKRESIIKYKSKFYCIKHKEDVPRGN
eukprot:2600559-Ditylum_brightwellii.AAC.1